MLVGGLLDYVQQVGYLQLLTHHLVLQLIVAVLETRLVDQQLCLALLYAL
jgi:hypothetical protein